MDCRLSLQLLFLTVLVCIHGTYAQCRKGEPKNVQLDAGQPDLNITLSSGPVAYIGDELKITCIADKPRYHFPNIQPMPPARVAVYFDGNELKTCPRTGGRVVCVHTFKLSKAANDVSVLCFARNSGPSCRTKTLLLTISERTIQKSNSTNSSKMSTPADQLMPSASLTMNSNGSLVTTTLAIPSHSKIFSSPVEMISLSSVVEKNFTLPTLAKIPPHSSSVEMISSSSAAETNSTSRVTSVASSPTTTVKSESSSAPRDTGGEGGKQGEEKLEDDDEVNDVKKLITATLILVIITLVLMAVAIVYVVRSLAIS